MKGLESEVYAGGLEGAEEQLGARREVVKLLPREAIGSYVEALHEPMDNVVPGVDLDVVLMYPWGTQEGTPQMRSTDGS